MRAGSGVRRGSQKPPAAAEVHDATCWQGEGHAPLLELHREEDESSRPNQIEGTEKKAVLMIVTALSKEAVETDS